MKGFQTGSKEDGKRILQQFSKCGLGISRQRPLRAFLGSTAAMIIP